MINLFLIKYIPVSPRWALTSAFCVKGRTAANLKLVVGRLAENVSTEYQVAEFIAHEGYWPDRMFKDDIALVKTTQEILLSADVGIICLPFRYDATDYKVLESKELTSAGWGPGATTSKAIAATTMKITPQATCTEAFPGSYRTQICTSEYKTNACQVTLIDGKGAWKINVIDIKLISLQFNPGTSFFYQEPEDKRLYAFGIVTGKTICTEKTIGLNTRITGYLAWVKQKTSGASFCNSSLVYSGSF